MSLKQLLQDLNDEQQYVRKTSVPIFDEHKEVYYVDAKGKPCSSRNPKAKKRVRVFDRKRLAQIAAACNKRDMKRSLAPITIGHTIQDEEDETKQPEIVGYAKGYRVTKDPDLQKYVLTTDYYIKRDKFDEAKTYPRTSVELWPADKDNPEQGDIIDPIALLRRTPHRDLGQWTYSRSSSGRTVIRYSREMHMNPEDDVDLPPEGDDMDGGMGEEEGGEPGHQEKMEQYMRHCHSHPYAKYFADHYAEDEGGEEEPMDEGADPTDPPVADEDSEQYSAGAFPSATNGGLPDQEPPMRHGKKGEPSKYAKQNAKLRKELALVRAEKYVSKLRGDGYDVDEEATVKRFARLVTDDAMKDEDAYLRRHGRRAPVGGVKRVPSSRTSASEQADKGMPKDQAERVTQYCREKGVSWEQGVKAILGR